MVAAGSRCRCHLFSSHGMGLSTLRPLPATSPAQEVPQQHQAALCKPAQGRCRSVPQVKPNAQEPCPEQFVTNQVWLLLYPRRARYRNPFPFLCCQCLSLTTFSSLCSSVPPVSICCTISYFWLRFNLDQWNAHEWSGSSSLLRWHLQPMVGAMDMTCPSEAARGSGKGSRLLSTSSSPQEVQCAESVLSGSLNLSNKELVMTFSFWKILRHLLFLGNNHSTHPFKKKLEIIFGDRCLLNSSFC